MDREMIARQVMALASDLSDAASMMEEELRTQAKLIKESERIQGENKKRSGAGTALVALPGVAYSPINHYRSRLDYIGMRLAGVVEYMKQKQVW